MEITESVNSVPIRLTYERWVHIVENHDDLAGKFHDVLDIVSNPDVICEGKIGELIAIRRAKGKNLVVVYRELSPTNGFIITAFQASKIAKLIKTRKIIWRKQPSTKP